jgi:hypothetical protein
MFVTNREVMMRDWFRTAFVCFAMLIGAMTATSPACATIAGAGGPLDTYAAPVGGSHINDVESYLIDNFGFTDLIYVGRFNGDGTGLTNFNADLNGAGASLVVAGIPGTSGTWTFNQGSSTYEIVALDIFTASNGAIYKLDQASLSGFWNTDDIKGGGHNLSHIDFYAVKVRHRVPEPTSFFLMGGGVAGIRMVRRKKRA